MRTSKSFSFVAIISTLVLVTACTKPTDIVLGAKPVETITANSETIRKLPLEDRELLIQFVMVQEIGKALPAAADGSASLKEGLPGKTVGEALELARAWEQEMKAKKAAREEADRQAELLKQKVLAEQKRAQDEILGAANIALVRKQVLAEDMMGGRYTDELKLTFAIDNKTEKLIKLLKGKAVFTDSAGDEVGELYIEFDEGLPAKKVTTTTGGVVWRILPGLSGSVPVIARTNADNLKMRFEPEAVVFQDGSIIKAPPSAEQ